MQNVTFFIFFQVIQFYQRYLYFEFITNHFHSASLYFLQKQTKYSLLCCYHCMFSFEKRNPPKLMSTNLVLPYLVIHISAATF